MKRVFFVIFLSLITRSIYGQIKVTGIAEKFNNVKIIKLLFLLIFFTSQNVYSQASVHTIGAELSYSKGNYEKAIRRYQKAMDVNSAYRDVAYQGIGNCYLMLGQYDMAEENYRLAYKYQTQNIYKAQILASIGEWVVG